MYLRPTDPDATSFEVSHGGEILAQITRSQAMALQEQLEVTLTATRMPPPAPNQTPGDLKPRANWGPTPSKPKNATPIAGIIGHLNGNRTN